MGFQSNSVGFRGISMGKNPLGKKTDEVEKNTMGFSQSVYTLLELSGWVGGGIKFTQVWEHLYMGLFENVGYFPNEIAI